MGDPPLIAAVIYGPEEGAIKVVRLTREVLADALREEMCAHLIPHAAPAITDGALGVLGATEWDLADAVLRRLEMA